MRLKPGALAAVATIGCVAVAVWGYSVRPDQAGRWLLIGLFQPALWGFVELAQSGDRPRETAAIMRLHRWVFAAMGLIVVLSVAPQLAITTGLISAEWGPMAWRVKGAVVGGALAVWGNYLPKQLSPWRHEDEPFDWQGVHRFAARSAVVTGLAAVVVSTLLPLASAKTAVVALMATFTILVLGRKLVSVATHPQEGAPE